jgi:hypothetical protein
MSQGGVVSAKCFEKIPTCAGLAALQRYAGRLIEIRRMEARTVIVRPV